jgi:hypothetical protein
MALVHILEGVSERVSRPLPLALEKKYKMLLLVKSIYNKYREKMEGTNE